MSRHVTLNWTYFFVVVGDAEWYTYKQWINLHATQAFVIVMFGDKYHKGQLNR